MHIDEILGASDISLVTRLYLNNRVWWCFIWIGGLALILAARVQFEYRGRTRAQQQTADAQAVNTPVQGVTSESDFKEKTQRLHALASCSLVIGLIFSAAAAVTTGRKATPVETPQE
jgi:hypothetical protein